MLGQHVNSGNPWTLLRSSNIRPPKARIQNSPFSHVHAGSFLVLYKEKT